MATTGTFEVMNLPDEILLMVIQCLDFDSLLDAVYVNRHFRALAEPFIYESITVLHGEKALNLSHSLVKDGRRPGWIRSLLISTKFGQEQALMKLPPSICLMDNLQDLRLETPDCNLKKPEDRKFWIALQDCYERIFHQSSVLIPDPRSRLLTNLKSCVLHFVDTHTELYSMSRYSSIFLHPTLESLTISCMSTDVPHNLFKDVPDPTALQRSTALEHLHLEECDLHPASLQLLLSFPRALKSLKISEGIRYDGIFRAGSSRTHGNVKPGPFTRAIVDTCKDSLESLSLALGYIRPRGLDINHKEQYLKLNELNQLKHLEVNNRTLNLIRDRPNCDHNTWKRFPSSLETFKVFAVPLLPPQQDAQRPYVPIQPCIIRAKQQHGVPNLQTVICSYEHYENTDDEEMNFSDLLMDLVYNEANGNPPVPPANQHQDAPPHANPLLNILQNVYHGVAGGNAPPPPAPAAPIPHPATTNFITAATNTTLQTPTQYVQPPRFPWRTPGRSLYRRPSRPELSRSDTAKLSLLSFIQDSVMQHFAQSQTRLQIDLVTLPRGFIPPYLFPEDKPKVHEAWFDSAHPMTPDAFVEDIRRTQAAMRMQINRNARRAGGGPHLATTAALQRDLYETERERSRNRFMRRLREEEMNAELVPELDGAEVPVGATDSDTETDDETVDGDDMEVEDMLEMLVAEARADVDVDVDTEAGEDDGGSSSSSSGGSLYVDASTEVEMSEVDSEDEDDEDEDFIVSFPPGSGIQPSEFGTFGL